MQWDGHLDNLSSELKEPRSEKKGCSIHSLRETVCLNGLTFGWLWLWICFELSSSIARAMKEGVGRLKDLDCRLRGVFGGWNEQWTWGPELGHHVKPSSPHGQSGQTKGSGHRLGPVLIIRKLPLRESPFHMHTGYYRACHSATMVVSQVCQRLPVHQLIWSFSQRTKYSALSKEILRVQPAETTAAAKRRTFGH